MPATAKRGEWFCLEELVGAIVFSGLATGIGDLDRRTEQGPIAGQL